MEKKLYIICEKEWFNLKNKKLEQNMYNHEWSLKYIEEHINDDLNFHYFLNNENMTFDFIKK